MYVYFYAKIFLILYPFLENLTACITLVVNIVHYLNSTLEEIDVNRTNVPRTKTLDLKLIPTLIVLNHGFGDMNSSELSGFIRRKVDVAC